MNHPPQPSEANVDLARKLRETCVHFTEAADESYFFRQLYLLIASIFGKIEDIFLLWRAGKLPPVPVRPRADSPRVCTAPRTPGTAKRRRSRNARIASAAAARPIHVRRTATSAYPTPAPTCLKPSAETPRIDRYPKPR